MKKIFIFLLLVSLVIPQVALADGMIIPPPDQNVTQAQQRALIVHQNGKEDLIIALEFSGNAREFAWFLPVPERPEIKKGNDEIFTKLGELTKPKKNLLEKLKGEGEYYPTPFFKGIGAGGPREEAVQVIETKRVGILDVTVLQASAAADLEGWLKENGYKVPGELEEIPLTEEEKEKFYVPSQPAPNFGINLTRQIFQEYLDKGWYFVAAKIATEFLREFPQASPFLIEPPQSVPLNLPEEGGESLGVEAKQVESSYYPQPPSYYDQAHITPLHLTFKTAKIVYPMKITSLNNDSSPSVLLYVLADHKKKVANYQYQYIGEREEENLIFKTQYANKVQASELKEWLPSVQDGYLSKLYAPYVSPSEMREDLRFENTEDDRAINIGEMRKRDWLVLPLYLVVYGPIRILAWFTEGPIGYSEFFRQLGPIFPLILVSFLGGLGILWVTLFYFLLSRTKEGLKRVILYMLQFPGVWVFVNLLSLIFVIPWLVILRLLGVDSEIIIIHLLLKNNVGAVFFTAIFYALQARIHLIFKKEK